MRFRKFVCALVVALFSLQTFQFTARADEGMWPFNNIPREEIKKKYGFEVTDEWLKKVQTASVRFNNGGSGSFVSPNGLVLTNYHIVEDFVGELSTAQKDYAKEGFVARTQADEMKIPNVELNELISIEDVTGRVNGVVTPGMSDADALVARRKEMAAIEAESTRATGLRSDVVALYQGGQYNLYRYKKYTDVRLVFAPEFQAAFFGGDPDNFNFPRFNIDMALVRVYENDQPVHPASYFKWSTTGAKEGDLAFVIGNPGSTARLNTVAHLEELRDTSIPIILRLLERREVMLKKYMAMGAEQTRRAQNELNSIQNSLKVYRGQLAGLKDKALIDRKMREEAALRKWVAADAARQDKYGKAWDAIAKAHVSYASFARERRIYDLAGGFNTSLFGYARTLVRMAFEKAKPNAERLPEFTDARLPALQAALAADAPFLADFEKLKLADSLGYMIELLPNDPLVKQIMQGKTPEARAAELIDGSKLNDAAYRKQLASASTADIEASTDPMIVLARTIDPMARKVRALYENSVTGVERANYPKIALARFDQEGTKLYPDATFTPRLSYGTVKGYSENGKRVTPFTTLGGLYDRATNFKNEFPYNLPPRWMEKKSAIKLSTPFNFVSTDDIIGGNSGSPTINKDGELIGLIFDGNIQSLVGNFIYDESINRAISVDVRGMTEVLRKVFEANQLADELTKGQAGGVSRLSRAAGR
ncbi:MAG TPA: S46 family peptidase [Pyrinomonadaceae bacterium]|nr:S46 family peptidase [Pyrinomonadaceae bacterium]